MIGPEEPIPYPNYTEQLDCELEIGIVIGREGRNLRVKEARDYIAGYTIFVDCSAREVYQRSDYFGQAKTKDFCNVLGPCLTTADEIDEANLHVRLLVDGEEWYAGNTATGGTIWPSTWWRSRRTTRRCTRATCWARARWGLAARWTRTAGCR